MYHAAVYRMAQTIASQGEEADRSREARILQPCPRTTIMQMWPKDWMAAAVYSSTTESFARTSQKTCAIMRFQYCHGSSLLYSVLLMPQAIMPYLIVSELILK